jgi:hypothetical protein
MTKKQVPVEIGGEPARGPANFSPPTSLTWRIAKRTIDKSIDY